jgi:sugar O-acyltransferase (sialic acid O-acetyltransferase NeuD family)
MIDVIIIGAGGHGAEIDEYIAYNNLKGRKQVYKVVGFLDDNPDNYAMYQLSAPLLGEIKGHKPIMRCKYIIGIANLLYRRRFVDEFLAEGAEFVTLVHINAYISPSAKIGKGVVIGPNANIGPNVKIGNYTLINSRCSLGHDTVIGDHNFISPNVCFSGFTKVGNGNLFGINCSTLPNISVGNRNKIAAGMVLDQNVGDDSVVFYRFKEKVIAIPKTSSE